MNVYLDAAGLSRSYGGHIAVDGVDLAVGPGEVHALVGLNGAGKTTLMRLLLGMLQPDGGRALVLGEDPAEAGGSTWRQVGYLLETPFFYPELTTTENISAAAVLHGMAHGEIGAPVQRVMSVLELDEWANRPARTLSQGNRQRLGLAAAIVHDPRILVLDEPANALDPAGVVLVRELLRRLAGQGTAILVSSHHLDQLARVADSITVIHRGRVVGSLRPTESELEQQFFDLVYEADRQLGLAHR